MGSQGLRVATADIACVVNLGCRVNRVECDDAERRLRSKGVAVGPLEDATRVLVNSCAVTSEAQAKTRKAVRHALGMPTGPEVWVMGCSANLFPDELAAIDPRVHVICDKATCVDDFIAHCVPAVSGQTSQGAPEGQAVEVRARRGIKVQDGCDNRCTYCIVWKARGASRSIPTDRIMAQVDEALAGGARQVALTGINLGKYRYGLEGGEQGRLAGLLRRMIDRGVPSIRLSSIEPMDVDDDLLEVMAAYPDVVCGHLHLPLQSGSTTVLGRMGRKYTAADFLGMVRHIRSIVPGCAITTDVIVGFPGETDDEFEQTLGLVAECTLSKVHAFRYSPRPGTPAASASGQVDPKVASDRAKRLRDLARELRAADALARLGGPEVMLVESVDDEGRAVGTTHSYHRIEVPRGSHHSCGPDLIRVQLVDFDRDSQTLIGRAL